MKDPGRTLIIGAGPTGLGAAYRLQEKGHRDFLVLEARNRAGGLASSYRDDAGFTWDVGGHVQHSHYRYYDDVMARMLGEERCYHERRAHIWLRQRFIPYPFQHNLHRLPGKDCERCVRDLERARAGTPVGADSGFDEWLHTTFGHAMAELFMVPYNRKVWGYPLSRLSVDWIRDRVAPPELERVKEGIRAGRDNVSWGPNRRFFYPLEGGTGETWRRVAGRVASGKILFGHAASAIDVASGQVWLQDGSFRPFDTLISTMPLDLLCRLCRGLDDATLSAADDLLYSSCHIIGIGLQGSRPDLLTGKGWIYFPDADAPFYRLTLLSDYSPNNVPPGDGYWSLMVEVCETRYSPVCADSIVDDCIGYLHAAGFLTPRARIVSRWHRREEHGYPTPFRGRNHVLRHLREALEPHRVYSRGRFGAWLYEISNQDHCFMQGVELVDRLLGDGVEETLLRRSPAAGRAG